MSKSCIVFSNGSLFLFLFFFGGVLVGESSSIFCTYLIVKIILFLDHSHFIRISFFVNKNLNHSPFPHNICTYKITLDAQWSVNDFQN